MSANHIKIILNAYNAVSPNKNKLIQKLCTENTKMSVEGLNASVTKLNAIIETKELKCLELEQRVNNGEFNTNTERVMHLQCNPLQTAMDKCQNESKEKIAFYEGKIKGLETKLEKMTKMKSKGARWQWE